MSDDAGRFTTTSNLAFGNVPDPDPPPPIGSRKVCLSSVCYLSVSPVRPCLRVFVCVVCASNVSLPSRSLSGRMALRRYFSVSCSYWNLA